MEHPSPLPVHDVPLITELAALLRSLEWTVDAVEALLPAPAREAMLRDQRVPALAALENTPGATALLTRLFVLGSTERKPDVEAVLPEGGSTLLAALGLIDEDPEGGVRARFDLRPHAALLPDPHTVGATTTHDWWVLSDLGEATTGKPLKDDHVLGIGGATTTLLTMTMRDHVGSALDLGTGCGIQALYLATHADRVVATDLSARACAITAFNAALNGVDIDVREGSLFDPVEGETFDLIVSNPPFVITPDSVRSEGLWEYRDGGMDRDNLIATVIREAPVHLAGGGTLQMLGNWEIPEANDPEEEWSARVEDWLDEATASVDGRLDAWVLQRDVLDPAQYVEMWMRDSGGSLVPRDQWENTYRTWVGDFVRAGVGAIGMGAVTLRRLPLGPDSPREGTRLLTHVPGGHQPRGEDVARVMRHLREPEGMWDRPLVVAADVTEERHHTPGEADPRAIVLHQGGGMGRSFRVGTAGAALVGACDGELTPAQITAAVAMLTEREVEEVRAEVSPLLLDLLRAGMLHPARE